MQIDINKNVKNLKIADHRYLYLDFDKYNNPFFTTEVTKYKYVNTYYLHKMPESGFDMRPANFQESGIMYQVYSYVRGQRYCIGQFDKLPDAQRLMKTASGDPVMYVMNDDMYSVPCCSHCGGVSSQWSIAFRRCSCE